MVKRTLCVATLLALALASEPSRAAPPAESRDDIMCRAESGLGFSYAYGGECWNANGCSPDHSLGVGYCDDCGDGNGCADCPGGCCVLGKSCSHSGTWGADCSGFTSKVWQVPDPYALNACNVPRYRATDFKQSGPYWDWIPWADLQRGDALATSYHVMIFDYWDGYGHPMVYEARGCYDGIVHNSRGCSGYEGARRHNITSCQCSPGQTESAPCGNCGTTTRTCNASCGWGPWSACSGQGCAPGATQSQSCGNCGSETRTCSSSCTWSAWSACTGQGCVPGAVESEACGNCGTRTRSCDGSCSWSAWSTCTGQGECAPGTLQSEACCDCGTRQRTCSSACGWPAWSACDGPDPAGGTLACDTGEPGPCAAGIERCVGGCLACQRTVEPEPELCDDVDNDCNGELNNGSPATLGDPPPAYAARRRDHSTPQMLVAGETGTVWVEFENVGTETWPAGAFWLASAAGLALEANALADPATWPAWDVAAVLDRPVAPGEVARLAFVVRAPSEATGALTESFVLVAPDGAELGCPEPSLGVSLSVLPRAPGSTSTDHAAVAPQRVVSASGCQSGPGGPAGGWLLWLVGILFTWRRARSAAVRREGAGNPASEETQR